MFNPGGVTEIYASQFWHPIRGAIISPLSGGVAALNHRL